MTRRLGVESVTGWAHCRGGKAVSGLLLGWLLASAPALALPPELEYAKGVVAFSRGELEQAAAHFQAVLEAQPEHVQAVTYLGQVALGQGRLQRAVELFERALEIEPDDAKLRLDLSLALVKSGRYARAAEQLEIAAGRLAERASVHYYLGYCRYRLGRYREAVAALRRAQGLDGGFAASAGYYLGLSLFQLGQQAEAARQFQRLAGGAAGGRIGDLARQNLGAMAAGRGSAAAARWGAVAATGAGYDSNVTLETDGRPAAAAPTAFVSVGVWGRPLLERRDVIELSFNAFRSFHFDIGDDVSGLNLTDLATVARYRHAFACGHRLELAYQGDLDMLDDLALATRADEDAGFGVYMHGHSGELAYRIPEGRWSETQLRYRFQARLFHPHGDGEADRDDFNHHLTLRQELLWLDGRIRLGLELGARLADARDRAWDLWGLHAGLQARFAVVGPLSVWLDAGWQREDHYRSQPTRWAAQRIDDLWTAAGGLSVELWDRLAVGLSYRYLSNRSGAVLDAAGRPAFQYQRHLVQLSLSGRL